METAISFMIIGFTFLIIIYVEIFMGKKSPTKKEIVDYQKVLNETDTYAEAVYGFKWKHDAITELMKQRKQKKSFTLIFSGIFIAFVFILLACVTTLLSLINIWIICISSIVLICYGLIKITESKKIRSDYFNTPI